jgi:hypothetical protein
MNLTPTLIPFSHDRVGEWAKQERAAGRQAMNQPTMREAMAFMQWAMRLGVFPTPAQIRERFKVSRSASYRWRDTLADVMGVPVPTVKRLRKRGAFAKREAA